MAIALPHLPDDPAARPPGGSPNVRRAAKFTGVSAFQMGLIHIIAKMMGRACSSTVRASRCRLVREAPADLPIRCTAWISSLTTASAT
jgi:hypothetical protein